MTADRPPWTGRPHGPPLGMVVSDLLLARSKLASVSIDYLDAYPQGFELRVRAEARLTSRDLGRPGDRGAPDIFGEDGPRDGEHGGEWSSRRLRVDVQFAGGRAVGRLSGYDRPADGPMMLSLSGRRGGNRDGSWFEQGYWIVPLPPPGPLSVLCEWPIAQIPVVRRTIDALLIRDGAERARAMFGDGEHVHRDGRTWRLGTPDDVAWINDAVDDSGTIASAVPPTFEAYCTLELPPGPRDADLARHERAVVELLRRMTPEQPWWLGFLDAGASDVVFPYEPRVTVYWGWKYVLVEAGPAQAAAWREDGFSWSLPELLFPADRSWLVSTMWDDSWSSIGGSETLIAELLSDPLLGPRTRRVKPGEDATPPGHARS